MVDGFFREIALVLKYENARQINLFSCFYAKKGPFKKTRSERRTGRGVGDVS